MKLRDHPLMKYRGEPNWPPPYLTQEYRQELIDEFGILRHVALDDKVPNGCFLTVEMNGLGYVGYLRFDDWKFRSKFVDAANKYLDRPIKVIGDLEFTD